MSRWGVLRSPWWWAALLVLVANDHWLKTAGALPGWLTGKLSDLAGLVVAPALVAVIAGARARPRRAVAFLVVVLPFVAINVSVDVAHVVEALVGIIGIRWKIWTDPTDLVALAILPVTWALLEAADRRPYEPRWSLARRAVELCALTLGALACIATGVVDVGAGWTTSAFVVNRSGGAQDVRIRWADAVLDCAAIDASMLRRALGRDAFGTGATFTLQPDETVPFHARGFVPGALDQVPSPPGASPCDAVLIQVDGLPDTLVFWSSASTRFVPATLSDGQSPGDGAFILEDAGAGQLVASATRGLLSVPLVELPDSEGCDGQSETLGLEWSGVAAELRGRIRRIEELDDGCLAIDVTPDDDLDRTVFLCVPAAAFPFAAEQLVVFRPSARPREDQLEVRPDSPETRDGPWLLVARGVADGDQLGGVQIDLRELECSGRRLDCGSFAIPAVATATLPAGASMWVGGAQRVIAAHPSCGLEWQTVGLRADVAVVF